MDRRSSNAPVLAYFTPQEGQILVRFTKDKVNLVTGGGVTLIPVPLTDQPTMQSWADQKVTLYETIPDTDNFSQSGGHPLVLRHAVQPFDTVRIMVTLSPLSN